MILPHLQLWWWSKPGVQLGCAAVDRAVHPSATSSGFFPADQILLGAAQPGDALGSAAVAL